MKRFKKYFLSNLRGFDFETLENSKQTIYALSKELNLIYFNPRWILFAEENSQGENVLSRFPLDTPITKAIRGDKLKEYYIQNYKRVLDSGDVWHHDFECSSKNEYRQYHQLAFPFKNGEGLIVVNALKINQPMGQMDRQVYAAIKKRYIKSTGFITQCSNCRHTQRADQEEVWEWVPEWVDRMPENISHSICPTCMDYYWKNDKFERQAPSIS